MLIRNKKNNIVVASGHGYTVEKVKKAMEFINHAGRNTTVQEWIEMYNYLKDANDSVTGCKSCAAAKYTASVRNYAHYGYMTMINEGHKPEEFGIGEEKAEQPIENKEERIDLGNSDEIVEKVKEALTEQLEDEDEKEIEEAPVAEENTVEEEKPVEEVKTEKPVKADRKASKKK